MLPTLLVRQDIAQQRLQKLFTDFSAPDLTLWLVYASRQHLPKITQEFIAFLIENLNFYFNQHNLKDLNEPERLNFLVLPIPHPYL